MLSTLHTNNAAQTIDRIIDSFPGDAQDQIRSQLAESLIGIFSQRLIPRVTGGLVPAYELLINNNAVANLIREKRTHEIDVVIETGTEQGMVDMNRSLLDLVRAGEITMESAYLYSMNPKALERLVTQQGVQLRVFSQEILQAAWREANAYLEEQAAASASFRTVYDSFKAFRETAFPFFAGNEFEYAKFAFAQVQGRIGRPTA